MRYSDIINFSPIETIIQLKEAGDSNKAKSLVESYVMSDQMADKLEATIINELQFDEVVDNKGVLIVGNYGTGKSHLMSVISSIANNEINLEYLKNKNFSRAMERIAGKFEVVRIEIGASENSLRNIVVSELEKDLEERGIIYKFPDASTITSNKPALQEMMAEFEEKYPERGYLLVIDELLDYLRTRKEHDLMLDLGFLREVGEIIKNSRFRLICGIQEQLFENPSFSFVSKSLNRVKDRFEQVIIRKEDTAYVVSERILGKTPEQKAKVREHLLPFCSLYSEMAERMEDFVELYPIHPAYIDTFNKVYIAEKREVLKTISITVKNLLDKEVPEEAPGIISFDSYWNFIKDNYARKAEVEVKEVIDKSAVLEDKIARSFPKKAYKAMALQIINALSVHRLTTSGIDVRIGLTAENLKDELCLFINNMPEMESEFLLSMIQTVLKDIINLVSGQFIEFNGDNGQYFLDLKKDIDYDAKISQKADMLSDDELNRYYFQVIYDCLEWDEEQYVPNFQIYEYLLNWESHNIFRRGYLFMGVPQVRSTAEPPRDFYINMLPPYGDQKDIDHNDQDEVMYQFKGDDAFNGILRLYAGALSMKELAGDQNTRNIYNRKAEDLRKKLLKWLNDNKNTAFNIIYKGISKQLIQVTHGKNKNNSNFKDCIDLAASICLDEYFTSIYQEFPIMKQKITQQNQADIIQRAIKCFAGQKTMDSLAFLDSFNLIENSKITVNNSKYAMSLVKKLDKLQPQGVINYSDIILEKYDEHYDKEFNINLEYYSVVLLALVYCGKANLTLSNGKVLSANNLDTLPKLGVVDIKEFKYLSKPKQGSIEELKRFFEILDIPTGFLINSNELEKGLTKALEKTKKISDDALLAKRLTGDNFKLWGEELIPNHIVNNYISKIDKLINEFVNFKNKYNTVPKLNNFSITMEELAEFEEAIKYIEVINKYNLFKTECGSLVNYISNIETLELPENLQQEIIKAKEVFRKNRDDIKEKLNEDFAIREVIKELNNIKDKYIELYFSVHSKVRLGINASEKKLKIIKSRLLSNLKKLSAIDSIFQINKLAGLENELSNLIVCYELTTKELKDTYICTHCKMNINTLSINAEAKLSEIEEKLEALNNEWTNLLSNSLEDPLILDNKKLLTRDQQKVIDDFIDTKQLPDIVDTFFVQAFNTLFSELDKVTVRIEDIENILLSMGPCTTIELKNKVNSYIDSIVKGKDIDKLRLIIQPKEAQPYDLVAEEESNY
ncbi:DUF6079 family protein [Clostridium neonatale]|uniref:DUF6079 family protein n=1 Tax=Clostridium neonatale TaxID=137838 RepID=UPI00291B3F9E|nr:DUF6079 family protein [Clostridium neonatale]CAI3202769.1 conserved hypothetical protein [Clostridium neonatale]CAI3214285.1 conserved hypothetical protein [Clostridium neonatale]CAI3563289.1 conserved hypothetical protein [Clostridium neonatale]